MISHSICFVIGANFGFIFAALMAASRSADDESERRVDEE